MHGTEVIPDLGNGVLRLDKDAHGHADGHDDQADTKDRINLTDDLVNGNKGGDEIIHQDDDQPEQSGGDNAGGAAVLEQGDDQAGRTHVPTMISSTTLNTRMTFFMKPPR